MAKVSGETADPVSVTIPSDTSNMLGKQTGYLVKLSKFTLYEIRILCFTSKGDGPTSPAVTVKTMEDGELHDCEEYEGTRLVSCK